MLAQVPFETGVRPGPTPTFTIKQVPSPNSSSRGGRVPIALLLHTMGGYLTGCDGWFSREDSQVSAHFGIGLKGEIHQYVPLTESAWANGILEAGNRWPGPKGVNPNAITVSIETEDNGSNLTPVSDAEYGSTLAVGKLVVAQYPSIRTLVSHSVISPSSRAHCCGERWINSGLFAKLARELGLEALS